MKQIKFIYTDSGASNYREDKVERQVKHELSFENDTDLLVIRQAFYNFCAALGYQVQGDADET